MTRMSHRTTKGQLLPSLTLEANSKGDQVCYRTVAGLPVGAGDDEAPSGRSDLLNPPANVLSSCGVFLQQQRSGFGYNT